MGEGQDECDAEGGHECILASFVVLFWFVSVLFIIIIIYFFLFTLELELPLDRSAFG